jgi:hypothetical protein
MNRLSKEFIESGKVSMEDLLCDSLFYPACWIDGNPIKFFNEHYDEYGITSYVYVDYAMSSEELMSHEDSFRHYRIYASRELKEQELVVPGFDWEEYASILSPEEKCHYQEIVLGMFRERIRPFARWLVYEREEDAPYGCGPERFSLLYIGGEAVATYAALFLSRRIAPKAVAIVRPGTGFGGNYTNFYDSQKALMKIINVGIEKPKFLLKDGNQLSFFDMSV